METIYEMALGGVGGEDVALLVVRCALGFAFGFAGFQKTFKCENHKNLKEALEYAGFSKQVCEWLVWPVCLTELFGGWFVVVGMMTVVSALGLFCVSCVAFLTVERRIIEPELCGGKCVVWYEWLMNTFWIPAVWFMVAALVLVCFGAGRFSVDWVLM